MLLFITIPIVVHGIGTASYGIFALVSVIIGYVAFLDLGLTAAVVRSVSQHYTVRDMRALERAAGTALTVLILLGFIGGIVIVALSSVFAQSVLHVPPELRSQAVFAFQVAGVGFGLNMILVVFAGVVQGLQRLDIFAVRSVVLSTLTSIGQIGSVLSGGGLRAVVVATVAVSFIGFLIFFGASRVLLPDVRFRPRFDRDALQELAGFGLFRFINQASGQITTQFDPIVVGIFWPVAAVGYYSVPLVVTQRFHFVEDSVASSYFPAAVEIHSRSDTHRERLLYLAAYKLVLVAMIFLMIVCVGYSGPILKAWVGSSIADRAAAIFAVLAIGYGLSAIIGIPAQASDATGHQRWTAGFAVASAIWQLTLALILVPRFGPVGAAYAVVINTLTQGTIFVLLVQRRFLRVGLPDVFRTAILRPVLAGLALTILVFATRGLAGSTVTLVVSLLGAGVVYLGLTLAFGVWTRQELQTARQVAHSLTRRARP